jgi:hypothetical protein
VTVIVASASSELRSSPASGEIGREVEAAAGDERAVAPEAVELWIALQRTQPRFNRPPLS